MEPFDGKVYLFKAKICVHYVYDMEFLGWQKYAMRGVELYEVPGDHLSMLLPPQVGEFALILDEALKKCENQFAEPAPASESSLLEAVHLK